MKRAGATTLVQSQEDCVVFGMPMEAIRLGAAEYVLPPKRISEAITTLLDGRVPADTRHV